VKKNGHLGKDLGKGRRTEEKTFCTQKGFPKAKGHDRGDPDPPLDFHAKTLARSSLRKITWRRKEGNAELSSVKGETEDVASSNEKHKSGRNWKRHSRNVLLKEQKINVVHLGSKEKGGSSSFKTAELKQQKSVVET